MEFDWSNFKETAKKILKNSWSIFIISVAIYIGWLIRGHYEDATKMKDSALRPTRTIEQTSIAVNERDELIIINRETGEYTIFDKSVRMSIVNQQLAKIQADFKAKE